MAVLRAPPRHDRPGFYAPRTAVLCSCKGLEPGLERNLTTLTEFDHQNYEVFFVLASESDPAHAIVKRVAASSRAKAHVLIAGAPVDCGEKVNNLRFAIEQLPPDFEFLAFADSDGRPGKSWLKRLVAPLNDSRIGATTTMRWLIPNRSDFATLLLAAWNAPVVTMLTEKGKNFCWGGGTAIRRSLFDQTRRRRRMEVFRQRRLFAHAFAASSRPLDHVSAGLPDRFVRRSYIREPARIHKSPNPDHARLRRTNVGLRLRNAHPVLPDAAARHRPHVRRSRRRRAGVSSRHADLSCPCSWA